MASKPRAKSLTPAELVPAVQASARRAEARRKSLDRPLEAPMETESDPDYHEGPPPPDPDQPATVPDSLCPSAQPRMDGAFIFAAVTDEPPVTLSYLTRPVALPPQPAEPTSGKRVQTHRPTELLRLAAPCVESRCLHFDGSVCQLGTRAAQQLRPVVDALPPCSIRAACRWWIEQGAEACKRCPQVVTDLPETTEERRQVGVPRAPKV